MKSRLKKGLLIPFLLLSNVCVLSTLASCNKTPAVCEEDKDGEFNLIFERRLWEKTRGEDVFTGSNERKWEYSKPFSVYKSDGTVYFSNDNDSITSEKFSINTKFNVELTWSLNGGVDTIPATIKEGEFRFAIEALNDNKQVVSSVELTDKDKLPKAGEMARTVFTLNCENKRVSYLRLKLYKHYFKNYRSLNIGIGRIKVFTGKNQDTTLPDGVEDNYKSTVQFTDYNSTTSADVRTSNGITLQDLRKNAQDLGTNGNQKVLVVPVRFKDTKDTFFEDNGYSQVGGFDGMRHIIEAAYFGKEEETGWESLSSYYWKSSYGRLNISGRVTPWYNAPYTVTEFYNLAGGTASVYNIVDDVTAWYKENFDDYMQFDQDNDGYIDCLQLVYTQRPCNYDKTSKVCIDKTRYPQASDLFWAFTWKRSGVKELKNWPRPYTFVWLSFDQLINTYNKEYEKNNQFLADAHTVIHESGHALGLLDYYSTGYDGSTPAGRVDMMDNNIGDHCAYSKWQFNWNAPKEQIIYNKDDEKTKKYEVTLKPFESSGDFVVIPAYSYEELQNGQDKGKLDSPMAEYITVEYYTPTGLNQQDSKGTYESTQGAQCMSERGLKLFHVDSRLAHLSFNNSTGDYIFDSYLNVNSDRSLVGNESANGTVDFPHHNDGTEANYDGFRMIRGLYTNDIYEKAALAITKDDDGNPYKDPETNNNLVAGHMFSNKDLFGSNSSNVKDFGKTNHQDFKFNNGYINCYDIEILSMTDQEVKLVFTYKAPTVA